MQNDRELIEKYNTFNKKPLLAILESLLDVNSKLENIKFPDFPEQMTEMKITNTSDITDSINSNGNTI